MKGPGGYDNTQGQGYYPSFEQYGSTAGYDMNNMNGNVNGNVNGNMNNNMNNNMMNGNSPQMMNNNNNNMFYSPPMNTNAGNVNYNQPNMYSQQPQQNMNMGNQFGDPNQFIANLSTNPLTQAGLSYGLNYGQSLFSGGKQYVDSNLGRYISLSTLKIYFNVNTSYVFNKIKLLFLPFTQKVWKRRIHRHGDVDSYLPPRDDVNAPDLYIPLMAFITYFLLYGFQLGMNSKFTPDILGATITKYIIYWILELLAFRFGFFFANSDSISVYDMVSYTGYKYVLLVGKIISEIIIGTYTTLLFRAYFAGCIGYFILKTLRLVFSSSSNQMNSDISYQQGNSQRSYFVVIFAALQAFLTFLI